MDLSKKYKIEREFHDNWAKSIVPEKVNYIQAFEAYTALENRFALKNLKPIKDKKILDIGCGMGDAAIYFGIKGARVEAVDISPGMIKVVKQLIKNKKLTGKVKAKVMVAEKLDYPSGYFDCVFGNGLLHHTAYDQTLKEVWRVLKPGGKAVFVEPLSHNPIINIYRKMAKEVRTPTEVPLNYLQLNKLSKANFKKTFHKEFHLFTLLTFVYFFVFEGSNPNKERYWKKIIDESKRIEWLFSKLYFLDRLFLTVFPFLRRYCWNTVLVFEK